MAFYKNTASQKVSVLAVNPTTGSGVAGDASNITAQISKDGGSSAATNDTNPTELNATHHPGVYIFDLTQAETNANMVIISAKSTTHPVAFDPVTIYTTNLDDFKADVSSVATTSQLQGVSGVLATTSQLVGVSGKLVSDIDAVPTVAETYAEFISGSNEDAFKADVSALATTSQLVGVSGKIVADVAAVPTAAETYSEFTSGSNENAFKADVSSLATTSQLQGVSGVVATTSQLVGVSGKLVSDIDAVPTAAETYAEFISGSNEDAFKADVSALATTSQLQGVSGVITATRTELGDAATLSELQGVSGVMAKAADVATTSQLVGVSGKLVADIDAVPTAAETYAEFISGSNEDAFKADVSALATTSQLVGVSGVVRDDILSISGVSGGGDSAATIYTYFTDGTREDAFKADVSAVSTTSQLQGVSGVVATTSQLVGVSGKLVTDIAAVPTASETYAEFISGSNEDAFKADVSAVATTSQLQGVSGVMATSSELVGVSGVIRDDIISISGVSGGGDSASTIYTYFTASDREDVFKADVSAIATTSQLQGVSGVMATTSQLVGVSGVLKTDIDAVPTAAETYAEFVSGTNENAFKADVSSLATTSQLQGVSGVMAKTSELSTLATSSELIGVSGVIRDDIISISGVTGGGDSAATIYTYFTDGSRADAFKANVSAIATTSQLVGVSGVVRADIAALNDPTVSAIVNGVWNASQSSHTSAGTFGKYLDVEVSSVGGGSLTSSGIYEYFTSGVRPDQFKAGVSGLATSSELIGVSGVLATSSELIGVSGVVDSVKTKTDQLTFTNSNKVDSTTRAMDTDVITADVIATNAIGAVEVATDAIDELASAVWDKTTSGHSTTGTFGKNLDARVSENTPAKTYTYFTSGDNEDAFKSTFNITATGIVAELNSTNYDGVTFENAMKKLLSMSTGKIVESSAGVFDFYAQDNATILFTLTKSGSQRTRS